MLVIRHAMSSASGTGLGPVRASVRERQPAGSPTVFPMDPPSRVSGIIGTMMFEEWVKGWFDRPDPWDYAVADDLPLDVKPEQVITFSTELFSRPSTYLKPYSDNQVGNGLYALIWEGHSPLF